MTNVTTFEGKNIFREDTFKERFSEVNDSDNQSVIQLRKGRKGKQQKRRK